jgi:hypothetical protein
MNPLDFIDLIIQISGLKWQQSKTLYIFNHKTYWENRYIFPTLELTEFLMCSVCLTMVIIIGTTQFKTIFNFSRDIGKDFISNALCSSDDSVTQITNILHIFTTDNVFHKPTKKNLKESSFEKGGAENFLPLCTQRSGNFLSEET